MRFYKILNREECHNGLQYTTGMVEDPLPWNPSGICEAGGIYFASKDILAFLSCGPWIREVTPLGEIYEDPGEPQRFKCRRVRLGERRRITAVVIQELIDEGADPKACDSETLINAAERSHTEVVKVLEDWAKK